MGIKTEQKGQKTAHFGVHMTGTHEVRQGSETDKRKTPK